MEMKEHLAPEDYVSVDARVQYFLDRFYMSRIGLRMLIHQHRKSTSCSKLYLFTLSLKLM